MTARFSLDLAPAEQAELNAPVDPEAFGSLLMLLTSELPLSSASVLALVTPADHPLHHCFEWDDRRGASRWRFVHEEDKDASDAWAGASWRHRQIGSLIGAVTITIDEDDPVPLFGPRSTDPETERWVGYYGKPDAAEPWIALITKAGGVVIGVEDMSNDAGNTHVHYRGDDACAERVREACHAVGGGNIDLS